MKIFNFEINPYSRPLYIAEISCNHQGSLEKAKELIRLAKEVAKADIVKIQVYTPKDMIALENSNNLRIDSGIWRGKSLQDLYTKTQTPYEWVPKLFETARQVGIPIFSSVFSEEGLKVLEDVGCEAYKIASYEFNDINLIKKVRETGKPIFLSIGAATKTELEIVYKYLNETKHIFMHCVSKYPCPLKDANLGNIEFLNKYTWGVGYSDHTDTNTCAQLSVILGAKFIEKHLYNPVWGHTEDIEFSHSPDEFSEMVDSCNHIYDMISVDCYRFSEDVLPLKRYLYAKTAIKKGDKFTEDNIITYRAGLGINAIDYFNIVDKVSSIDLDRGDVIKMEFVQWK